MEYKKVLSPVYQNFNSLAVITAEEWVLMLQAELAYLTDYEELLSVYKTVQ